MRFSTWYNILLSFLVGVLWCTKPLSLYAQEDEPQLDSLVQLAQDESDDSMRIVLFERIANIYFNRNKLEKGVEYYQKMADIYAGKPGKKGVVKVTANIGRMYYNVGDYSTAMKYYMEALKIMEENDDDEFESYLYNYIGSVFKRQKKLDKAVEYYKKGLESSKSKGNKLAIADSYNRIGIIYHMKSSYDTAFDYYNKSLKLKIEVGFDRGVAESYGNIGILYENQQLFDKAIEYYNKSIDIREKINDEFGLAINYNNLGKLYSDQGKPEKGLEMLLKSLELSKRMNALDLVKATYLQLSKTYKQLRNFPKALEAHEMYAMYSDSIYSENSQRVVAELEKQYEIEKKEKEIELLNKEKKLQELHILKDEAELRKSRYEIVVLGVILLGTLLLVGFIAYQSRQKKLKNELLAEKNTVLNQQNEEIKAQSEEIERQRSILEHFNEDLTDSITYAHKIQGALLQLNEEENGYKLPEKFVLFLPKDIVSGDFYWSKVIDRFYYFAVADCTGHGVPGAFMSMLGVAFLNEITSQEWIAEPGEILNRLREKVIKDLKQSIKDDSRRDGMDIALIRVDLSTGELIFSGAHNPIYHFSNGVLNEYKADRMPIGLSLREKVPDFTNQKIQLNSGDRIYLFSDGFADQFGGKEGKKYTYLQLKQVLGTLQEKNMNQQSIEVLNIFEDWREGYEQLDDVCLAGLEFKFG